MLTGEGDKSGRRKAEQAPPDQPPTKSFPRALHFGVCPLPGRPLPTTYRGPLVLILIVIDVDLIR